ncbi:hypothetical protein [Variovorax sp. CY25R-8]|uniref:hypothetical protein n=1 Tax=Variovorax sp. CY25R-8 TaxID=2855501 RepID=UPI0021BBA176|nr:hypothetical protein [Variovorax sp. CY25R-8]MCT8178904.1 hypothetical protein [Variovorax sp. CY25R-8]
MVEHPDGHIYGWRGLVKYTRINPYIRKKKIAPDAAGRGCAGAMNALLAIEPELEKRFSKWILQIVASSDLGEIKKPNQRIWSWFIDELRKLGYEIRNEWPFSTRTLGFSAVARHVKKVLASNPRKAAYLAGGQALASKLLGGDGVDRPVRRVFQRVEMDAHHLNGIFCILVPSPLEGHVPVIVRRLWVIVILEVFTRVVLGYHLSLRSEINKQDVLLAIRSALSKWQRKKLNMGELRYMDEAALPSGHHDRYLGLCWDEMSVDGAMAGKCQDVRNALENIVGAKLIEPSNGWSARRLKDDRPFIESFFNALGQRSLNRMSNSTGSRPSDKQGRDPIKVALKSQFQLEYLEELLDVLIANYHAIEQKNLTYRTPLQYLDQCVARENSPAIRRADPKLVDGILAVRKMCEVKGGYLVGRRPFVNFFGAVYSGEILEARHDLVGKKIWITNHLVSDARVVQASTVQGYSLGTLRAAAPWHGLPHSLEIRRAIRTLIQARRLKISAGGDAIAEFIKFSESFPNKKLPAHPTYLEVRRILEAAARHPEQLQQADLHRARARLDEHSASTSFVAGVSNSFTDKLANHGELTVLPRRSSTEDAQGLLPDPALPPLRKAANK